MDATASNTEAMLASAIAALAADRDPASRAGHAENIALLVRTMAEHGSHRHDPVRAMTACLGDRWTPLIMNLLIGGPLYYGELRRLMCTISIEGDISQRVLTQKLRQLERDGLVLRQATAEVPPRVEYRLSALGLAAYRQYMALMRWAEEATPAIREARAAYDAVHGEGAAGDKGDDDEG